MTPPPLAVRMLGACALLFAASVVCGEEYPQKPLRIVTSEAGGGNDVQTRLLAQGLAGVFGVQVVVDNRPSGVVPGDIVAKASPNGYTLLLYNNTLWTAPLLQTTPYDVTRDLAPVSAVSKAANVLVVGPAVPAKSVAELIALARANPGKLNYGSSGTGASNHLAGELFKTMAGVDIVRINYKGANPALTALLADELQLMFPSAGAVTPHIRAGRVRVLAVTSLEPTALVPGVPSIAASGLPGYESISTYGVFAPARTPRAIIGKVSGEIARFLARADVKAKFFNAGVEAAGGPPGALAATVKTETVRMMKLIKDAGISAQ